LTLSSTYHIGCLPTRRSKCLSEYVAFQHTFVLDRLPNSQYDESRRAEYLYLDPAGSAALESARLSLVTDASGAPPEAGAIACYATIDSGGIETVDLFSTR
jgi:hypothetical protein